MATAYRPDTDYKYFLQNFSSQFRHFPLKFFHNKSQDYRLVFRVVFHYFPVFPMRLKVFFQKFFKIFQKVWQWFHQEKYEFFLLKSYRLRPFLRSFA